MPSFFGVEWPGAAIRKNIALATELHDPESALKMDLGPTRNSRAEAKYA